jgi:hypothetical protein
MGHDLCHKLYPSQAFKGIAAANQRRRDATARREVEAALKAFADAAKPG